MTPLTTGRAPGGAPPQRANVLSLVAVVLLTLVAFSAFFIGFLLAPLAVLLFFSLIFYSRNRSAGRKGAPTPEAVPSGSARSRLIIEARERQAALALEERRNRMYTDAPSEAPDVAPERGDLAPEGGDVVQEGGDLVPEAISGDSD
jgi:hypothetical protein